MNIKMKQDIKKYYQKSVNLNKKSDFNDFLRQVGKTYLGDAINNEQFTKIINSIQENLNILIDDQILDLGCANGLITSKISENCEKIKGYDLSNDLINIAKKYHQKANIVYKCQNITEIDFSYLNINKIYMYEVLQHLEYNELRILLENINKFYNTFSFFIGSIPDQEKLFEFYNTKERKKYYFDEILSNNKFHIGNWWYKEQIQFLCEDLGFECKIIEQDKSLHTAHYRFDCLIEKR